MRVAVAVPTICIFSGTLSPQHGARLRRLEARRCAAEHMSRWWPRRPSRSFWVPVPSPSPGPSGTVPRTSRPQQKIRWAPRNGCTCSGPTPMVPSRTPRSTRRSRSPGRWVWRPWGRRTPTRCGLSSGRAISVAASATSRPTRRRGMSSMPPRPPGVYGGRLTGARPSLPHGTTSCLSRWVRSRSTPGASSGLAPASPIMVVARRTTARVSTSRPIMARRGPAWVSPMATRSGRSSSTRVTRTGCSSPSWARCTTSSRLVACS